MAESIVDGRSEFKRINSAILQFLLDGERGRHQVAADVSRMVGVHLSASALLVSERLRAGSMRVNDLGTSVGITSGGITRQVQDLEAKGLIERSPDETDGRATIVRLSTKGMDVVRLADSIRDFSTRRALREWGEEEIEQVAPLLERLAEGLRQGAAGGSVFDIIPFELNTPADEWMQLMEVT
jgi:DNA-binding MarR family transcriptional regulator